MKKSKFVKLAISGAALAIVVLTLLVPKSSNAQGTVALVTTPVATTARSQSSTAKNPTIASILIHFPTLADFEKAFPAANNPDDMYLVVNRGDGGWAGFPAGDNGSSKVLDKNGNVIEVYNRNDPTGATIAQIKDAYK